MKRDSDYVQYEVNKAPRYEGGGRGRGRGRDSWSGGSYYSDRDDYGRDYRGGPPRGGRGGLRGRGRGRLAGRPPQFPLPDEPVLVQDIPVKKEHAGAVIGVGGERVRKLREDTGCKVHIKKTTPETLQIVELTGRVSEIDAAIEALQRIISDVDPNYRLELPTKYACYIDIYPDMVGCVIGRHGDKVKQVKQESGAHVRVEDQQPDSDFQVVSIVGELDQVRAAYKMVASNLDQFDPNRVKHRPMRPFPSQFAEPYGGSGGPPPNDSYGPPGGGPPEFTSFTYANPAPIVTTADFAGTGAVFTQAPMDPNAQVQHQSTINLGGAVMAPAGGAASTIVVNPGGAGQAATPQVLVLQPDGTYKPVQAVVYSLPSAAAQAQAQMVPQQQPTQMVINQAQLEPQPQQVPQQQQQQQASANTSTGVSQVSLAGLTAALPAGARIISLSSLQDPATSSALTQLISPSSGGVQQGLVQQLFNPAAYAQQAKPAQQQGLTQIVAQGGYQ